MANYNVGKAFNRIENELIDSMMRNLGKHLKDEAAEGFDWEQWQVLQLQALEKYKADNKGKYDKQFDKINGSISKTIRDARANGQKDEELKILEAIKKGKFGSIRKPKGSTEIAADFFKLNDRKMNALITATKADFKQAERATLRLANDEYRKIIFDAQVYANSGAGTTQQAVDMATKDFLSSGINSIVYANGARHLISDYADMAIRTAQKRAYFTGEGEKRNEWGIHTVIMNKRGNACPKCAIFAGHIFIDDVWSGGTAEEGRKLDFPLLSEAMAAGLYHPRCKDTHSTYFAGITKPPEYYSRKEIQALEGQEQIEAKKEYCRRNKERFERLAKYSFDAENKARYQARADKWQARFDAYDNATKPKQFKLPTLAERKKNQIRLPESYRSEKGVALANAMGLKAGDLYHKPIRIAGMSTVGKVRGTIKGKNVRVTPKATNSLADMVARADKLYREIERYTKAITNQRNLILSNKYREAKIDRLKSRYWGKLYSQDELEKFKEKAARADEYTNQLNKLYEEKEAMVRPSRSDKFAYELYKKRMGEIDAEIQTLFEWQTEAYESKSIVDTQLRYEKEYAEIINDKTILTHKEIEDNIAKYEIKRTTAQSNYDILKAEIQQQKLAEAQKQQTGGNLKERLEVFKKSTQRQANGAYDDADLHTAGKMVKEEIDKQIAATMPEYRAKYDALKHKKDIAHRKCQSILKSHGRHSKEYNKVFYEWKDLVDEIAKLRESRPIISTEVLKSIRQTGLGTHKATELLKGTSKVRKYVESAFDYYPTEWLEQMISDAAQYGKFSGRSVNRGYYSYFRKEIAISGVEERDSIGTAIHEVGHWTEHTVQGINAAEAEFYARRTAGEQLKWLGGNYRRDEKTRFDNFVNAYMGKDYGGRAHELVSMGFQMVHQEYEELAKDEDMCEWILGLLAIG